MKVNIQILEKFKKDLNELRERDYAEDKRDAGIALAHKYYTYLKDNGEPYGAAALQVATNTGLLGKIANIHLRTQAVFDGKAKEDLDELQTRIVISLAHADMIQRIKHNGELTYDIISKYHKLTFETFGLSHYAWSGLVVEELLGPGKWMMIHDSDQREFDSILTQLSQSTTKSTYAIDRMLSSIHHSVKCLATVEQDYTPIATGSSSLQVATRYGVDISRIMQQEDPLWNATTASSDSYIALGHSYKILSASDQPSTLEDTPQLEQGDEDKATTHEVTLTTLCKLLYQHEINAARDLIVSNTININETCSNHATALHVASEENLDEITPLLLRAGALINATDDWGFTPLHHAAFNVAFDVARILLTAGANTTIGDQIGNRTALHYAAGSGSLSMTELFAQNGFIIDAKNKEGETPLDVAKKMGHAETVNFLAGEMHYFAFSKWKCNTW